MVFTVSIVEPSEIHLIDSKGVPMVIVYTQYVDNKLGGTNNIAAYNNLEMIFEFLNEVTKIISEKEVLLIPIHSMDLDTDLDLTNDYIKGTIYTNTYDDGTITVPATNFLVDFIENEFLNGSVPFQSINLLSIIRSN